MIWYQYTYTDTGFIQDINKFVSIKKRKNAVECISFYFLTRTACVTVPYIGVLPK